MTLFCRSKILREEPQARGRAVPMLSSSSWCRAISSKLEMRLWLCSDLLRIRSSVMWRGGSSM